MNLALLCDKKWSSAFCQQNLKTAITFKCFHELNSFNHINDVTLPFTISKETKQESALRVSCKAVSYIAESGLSFLKCSFSKAGLYLVIYALGHKLFSK